MNRESQLTAVFVEMADALVNDYDLQDFLQGLVDRTVELVGASAVGILMTSEGDEVELTAATTSDMEELEDFELEHEQGPCYEAYASGEQMSEPDLRLRTERWPEFARRALGFGYRSVHGFPLRVRDEVLGALNVFFSEPGDFEPDDIRTLQAVADVAAIGIAQKRSISRRRARQQDAIAELGRAALDDISTEVVLAQVAETVREVVGARNVSLLEVASAGGLVARAVSGDATGSTETAVAPGVIPVASWALQERRTVVVSTAHGEPPPGVSLPEDAAVMGAVIGGRQRDFGALVVWCDRDRTFDDDDVAFCESVATLVASIVARRKVETQLRQTQKFEAVGQLAGGVAHDFNNVLQIIYGKAELMELRSPGSEAADILAAAEQGRRLVERLLTFGRQQPATPSPVALNTLVAVADMLDRMVGDTIFIETVLSPEVGAVTVDETQLEQAIINLIINARDAMPGGGHITVTTALADLAELPPGTTGSFARLTVADIGTGMDDDVLAQAIEPFFTTKPPGEGTGLGLSTVYGAVTSAGGHLEIRTNVGEGTAFDLYLPHQPTIPDTRDAGPPEPPLTLEADILVVEDRLEIRELVTAALQRLGLTVRSADDGETALTLITDDGPPDLLITDVSLPGMQGSALADRVRASQPDVRVLYMSGYQPAGLDTSEGAAFLQKPFSLTKLTEQVQTLLH